MTRPDDPRQLGEQDLPWWDPDPSGHATPAEGDPADGPSEAGASPSSESPAGEAAMTRDYVPSAADHADSLPASSADSGDSDSPTDPDADVPSASAEGDSAAATDPADPAGPAESVESAESPLTAAPTFESVRWAPIVWDPVAPELEEAEPFPEPPRRRSRARRLLQILVPLVVVAMIVGSIGFSGLWAARMPRPARPTVTESTPLDVPGSITLPTPSATLSVGESPDRTEATGGTMPPGWVGDEHPLEWYFQQTLVWQPCQNAECTTFLAPLDWFDTSKGAITLFMSRTLGESEAEPYFVNPGGPGASAALFAMLGFPSGLLGHPVIGLDSRGSGQSTPVVCADDATIDEYMSVDSSPDDEVEMQILLDTNRAFAMSCRQHSGELVDHISSIETVYDYDLARNLVGQEKLNFYGASYGTYLGALYAELYPDKVGRMILDSAVHLRPDQIDVAQYQGFERNIHYFAQWCAQNSTCNLGSSEDEVLARVTGLLERLDSEPIPTSSGRMLTQSIAMTGLLSHLYGGAESYAELAQELEAAEQGNGDELLAAADSYNHRDPSGRYDSLYRSFFAIYCADHADDGVEAVREEWTNEVAERAPVLGPYFGLDTTCEVWPTRPAPAVDFSGDGAPPILLVQNTGDSATPLENAYVMRDEMPSIVLVTRESPGHIAFGQGSECIDQIVVDFIATGVLPESGTACPA